MVAHHRTSKSVSCKVSPPPIAGDNRTYAIKLTLVRRRRHASQALETIGIWELTIWTVIVVLKTKVTVRLGTHGGGGVARATTNVQKEAGWQIT